MERGQIDRQLGRGRILGLTAGAAIVAGLILLGGILPAEYHYDPMGLGHASGLDRLWAPEEKVVGARGPAVSLYNYARRYRSDEVTITLQPGGDPSRNDELEYKLRLPRDGSFVYSWAVEGKSNPKDVYIEAHGHTLTTPDKMTVAYYKKGFALRDNGTIIAPFDGIHGWYFQNHSNRPVTIKARFAGFYDLIPPGEEGNLGEIVARPVQ